MTKESRFKKSKTKKITQDNDLFYLGAVLVQQKLLIRQKVRKKNPGGKKLERPVKEFNKDLGRLNILIKDNMMKSKHCDSTQKIYRVREKGGLVFISGNYCSPTLNKDDNNTNNFLNIIILFF